jgi:peptidoglycan/LPS O-acetylase OafA/YrhL
MGVVDPDGARVSTGREGSGYRADIEGLRAVAVLGVLLYHVDLPAFSGGYLGVDVFFVISGYLIVRMIVTALAFGRFRIGDFYRRRIRRIVPALVSTVAFTVAVASLCQFADDYAKTAASGLAALLSVSNFYFLLNGGYFEGAAQYKALLHTWSLGVEEQFYLVMPALLILLARSRRLTRAAFAAGLIGSFALMVAIGQFGAFGLSEKTSFFMMPTRAWQFFAGGAISVFAFRAEATKRVGDLIGWAGLACVLAAFAGVNPAARLSGLDAVQPTVGAMLLVYGVAGPGASVTKLLATRWLTFIGKISYSVYLVHWPLVSLYKYTFQRELDAVTQVILVALSLLLGYLQWRHVEKVFRLPSGQAGGPMRSGSRPFWAPFLAVFAAVCAACAAVVMTGGLPGRFEQPSLVVEARAREGRSIDLSCRQAGELATLCGREDAPPRRLIAVVGDSHAAMILDELARAADVSGRDVIAYVRYGCPAVVGVNTTGNSARCAEGRAADLLDIAARDDVDGVLLVSRWAFYESGGGWEFRNNWLYGPGDSRWFARGPRHNRLVLRDGLVRLIEALPPGLPVGLLMPVPEPGFDAGLRARVNARFGRDATLTIDAGDDESRTVGFRSLVSNLPPAVRGRLRLYEPREFLCDAGHCVVAEGSRLYYKDSSHLTSLGAGKLGPQLEAIVADVTGGSS